jgi:hypothetical protein
MVTLNLAKPPISTRSHEIIILPAKAKYGKPCSLGLYAHQFLLEDIFKIAKLIAFEKATAYLYKNKNVSVKLENEPEESTHYIQVRSFIDRQQLEQTSLAFSICCSDMDSIDIRDEIKKYFYGTENISDADIKKLNLKYRKEAI